MMAPAGTPPDIVQKLSAEIDRILQEPDMQERARVLGFQIDSGKPVSPSDARQFLETEFATSGRVIKELGIEPE
jgi:tripartite-type tricarboxylate transporter receptor subunit TctC